MFTLSDAVLLGQLRVGNPESHQRRVVVRDVRRHMMHDPLRIMVRRS